MADDALGGLLNISISDSDDSSTEAATHQTKRPRDAQNEAEFQAVRQAYSVKIENGEVSHLCIVFPFPKGKSRSGR